MRRNLLNSVFEPLSKPSAMLLDTEIAARWIWSRKA